MLYVQAEGRFFHGISLRHDSRHNSRCSSDRNSLAKSRLEALAGKAEKAAARLASYSSRALPCGCRLLSAACVEGTALELPFLGKNKEKVVARSKKMWYGDSSPWIDTKRQYAKGEMFYEKSKTGEEKTKQ